MARAQQSVVGLRVIQAHTYRKWHSPPADEGVDAVTLGRQALESRVVSQDLELWMTNDKVVDGYNLVARAGRQVQEVHVKSSLSREDIKLAVVRVTSRIK